MDETFSRQIRIDNDGVWYYGDEEIFRKEIILFFYENLKRDQTGRYLIEVNDERCYITVEDTPFIVKSVYRKLLVSDNTEIICLNLSDETVEELNPLSLWVGKDNILYCIIKNGSFKARFSRAAYYQSSNYIEHDEENEVYFIPLNGQSFYIKAL